MKPFNPLEIHADHPVKIILVTEGGHSAKLHCIECNKWVKWLTKKETAVALELGLVEENDQ